MTERKSTLHKRDSRGRVVSLPKNQTQKLKRPIISVVTSLLLLVTAITGTMLYLSVNRSVAMANKLKIVESRLQTVSMQTEEAEKKELAPVLKTESKTEIPQKNLVKEAEEIVEPTAAEIIETKAVIADEFIATKSVKSAEKNEQESQPVEQLPEEKPEIIIEPNPVKNL